MVWEQAEEDRQSERTGAAPRGLTQWRQAERMCLKVYQPPGISVVLQRPKDRDEDRQEWEATDPGPSRQRQRPRPRLSVSTRARRSCTEDPQLRQGQQGHRDTLEDFFPSPMMLPEPPLDCGTIR